MSTVIDIQSTIIAFLADTCDIEINAEQAEGSLSEVGVDSFTLLELLFHLEQKYGIRMPAEILTADNTSSIAALAVVYSRYIRN